MAIDCDQVEGCVEVSEVVHHWKIEGGKGEIEEEPSLGRTVWGNCDYGFRDQCVDAVLDENPTSLRLF